MYDEMLKLHNDIRNRHGIPDLRINDKLNGVAQKYAQEMERTNNFSHVDSRGRLPGARITEGGYVWRSCAENIGKGYQTPDEAVAGWENSPHHLDNILKPNVVDIGFGKSGEYWVAVFARPKSMR